LNKRENIISVINGKNTGQIPVTPHWWGLYKFEFAGLLKDYTKESEAWSYSGVKLADIDSCFYEHFLPDMFHLTTGAPRIEESDNIRKEKKRIFEAVHDLESFSVIDEFVASHYQTKEDTIKSGVFDHILMLSKKYGKDSLLMLNEGNPISWILDPHGCIGFENGLISMIEKPDKMEYLIRKSYDALLPRMTALKEMGADGYIGSETYCSADIISPRLYRDLVFDAQRAFYTNLDNMGLITVTYFLGDIIPLIEDVKLLGVKGLMVEESKKNYQLDIGMIYNRLEKQVCLFGNLDSVYILQKGTIEDVVNETLRQMNSCSDGGFIMANGCPVSFNTPAENIKAMIDTARRYRPL